MAAGMCAAERAQTFGTIVVVGGGCYGSDYVRQLARARRAGAVEWESLIVVDRDGTCPVVRTNEFRESGAMLQVSDWKQYFADYLAAAAADPESAARDAIVPSPLMPHLMFDWVADRARARWPDRHVAACPLPGPLSVPWQRSGEDGTHYGSFADWICPTHCIEPRVCPHTRGLRSWSFPEKVREYVTSLRGEGSRLSGPVIFHCAHRAYGVGMFDTAAVVAGDRMVAECGSAGPAEILIGTMSHCHAALNVLTVGEPATDAPGAAGGDLHARRAGAPVS
jgi:hypothetical protein